MPRSRTAALAAVAVLAALLVPGVAAAQDGPTPLTRDELGLRATAGYAPDASTHGWVPVEVRLAPTRLFAGTVAIVAQVDGSRVLEERDVEVAAGTEKIYRFVVPPTQSVQLRITETGREPLGTSIAVPMQRSATFLVGVLGDSLPASLPPAAAVASDVRGVYAPIEPAWLELSPRALDGVSTLVVAASQLGQLGETVLARLHNAVALGTELVVVADQPGSLDLAGLPWAPATAASSATVSTGDGSAQAVLGLRPAPDAWTLTAGDLADADAADGPADGTVLIAAVSAGRGRVAVIGVGLGDEGLGRDARLWGQVLQPSARLLETSDDRTTLSRSIYLAQEAVRSRGLSLPSLPWLTAFLVAFVLLVGPVNAGVLSRLGRSELAWVTVPAITVVFAAGAYVGARGASPPAGLAASATYWIDGQGQELAVSAVRSPREGSHTVTFPGDGWAVLPAVRTASPTVVDASSGDTTARMQLGALQVGTALGWRPTDQAPPLEVTATAVDEQTVTVTVHNRSAQALTDLEVHAGTFTDRIGDLAAGESTEVTLTGLDELPLREPWMEEFEGLRDFTDANAPIAPRSLEAVLRWTVLDGSTGLVWVVGTAAQAPGPLPTSSGGPMDEAGGVVAVGVTPQVTGAAALSPAVVTRSLLPPTSTDFFERSAPTAINAPGPAILRYRLPGGTRPDQLIATIDRDVVDGQGFRGGGGCWVEPVIGPDGQVIGEQEVCEDIAVLPAQPVPECPPGADCTLDGDLWEVCTELEDGGRECTVTVVEPDAVPPDIIGRGRVQLEVYDHGARQWVFANQALTVAAGGAHVLDPDRFLSPLGEVFVRAAGELFPFDFSGRGVGATLAVPA